MGILRSTFVIDKNGILRHALYGITAKGHAAEVFKLVQALYNTALVRRSRRLSTNPGSCSWRT